MKINFKKLDPRAVMPAYAKAGDAGLDLTAIDVEMDGGGHITYNTGLAVEIPAGYVGLLFPRSGIVKKDLCLSNSVAVIDSGYRGEMKVVFSKMAGDFSKKYALGERVAQLVIIPYPSIEVTEVKELSSSERGATGFGSTDKTTGAPTAVTTTATTPAPATKKTEAPKAPTKA